MVFSVQQNRTQLSFYPNFCPSFLTINCQSCILQRTIIFKMKNSSKLRWRTQSSESPHTLLTPLFNFLGVVVLGYQVQSSKESTRLILIEYPLQRTMLRSAVRTCQKWHVLNSGWMHAHYCNQFAHNTRSGHKNIAVISLLTPKPSNPSPWSTGPTIQLLHCIINSIEPHKQG